jgi:hypothetical protein
VDHGTSVHGKEYSDGTTSEPDAVEIRVVDNDSRRCGTCLAWSENRKMKTAFQHRWNGTRWYGRSAVAVYGACLRVGKRHL